jgi:hypothetical protein
MNYIVGFEVLITLVPMKISVYWHILPCSPLKVNRRFGGACDLQGVRGLNVGLGHSVAM